MGASHSSHGTYTKEEAGKPMLIVPQQGVRYYLVHWESGKFMHPASNRPGNNEKIVVVDKGSPLAAQFRFVKGNKGHLQLQHYASGKYVHPFGGKAFNNKFLCLYSGSDGQRTGVDMIMKGGRTYLRCYNTPKRAVMFVHPNGGANIPEDHTALVYHADWRPSLAFGIIPAEDVRVLSTEFDTDKLQAAPTDTVVSDTKVFNGMDYNQHLDVFVKYSRSTTNSFTLQFHETVAFGMKTTTEATLPGVTEKVEMSFNVEAGQSRATCTSTTTGVESSIKVKPNVPAKSGIKVIMQCIRKSGEVPFKMLCESSSGQRFYKTGKMKTEYFFEQEVHYQQISVSSGGCNGG